RSDAPDAQGQTAKHQQIQRIKKESQELKSESEDGEDEYKWWQEGGAEDSTIKWTTLQHNGVLFAPDPEEYPGGTLHSSLSVKKADFRRADVGANAGRETRVFCRQGKIIKEFAKCDFRPIYEHLQAESAKRKAMSKEQKAELKKARDADMEKYGYAYIDGRKEKVGNFRVEPPGLFRGRGEHPKTGKLKVGETRNSWPSRRRLQQRIVAEDITINIGKDAIVPKPPPGHKWASVIHDNTVTWLAMWKENINNAHKYIFLAAGSSLKGQSDLKKYEKARALKKIVHKVREDYRRELKDNVYEVRQRATVIYLIDVLALRAGNEKGEDEADTVGCCSLRYEHVTLEPPCTMVFDFLGKDSIRYYNSVEVDQQVFKNIKYFKKNKKVGDLLFDKLDTADVNQHLSTYMKGLTAKVFRTYNASHTFQEQLAKETAKVRERHPAYFAMTGAEKKGKEPKAKGKEDRKIKEEGGSPAKKRAKVEDDATMQERRMEAKLRKDAETALVLAYNRANRDVAVLCNHQRSVSKNHALQMGRIADKIRGLKVERRRLRREGFAIDKKKFLKGNSEYAKAESDLDDAWVEEYEKGLIEKARERLELAIASAKHGGKPPGASASGADADEEEGRGKAKKGKVGAAADEDAVKRLSEKLDKLKEKEKLWAKERSTGKVDPPAGQDDVEKKSQMLQKILEKLAKVDGLITKVRADMTNKEENKTTALTTSKLNYIDPRITFAWCKATGVELKKVFSKTLIEKFKWAEDTTEQWVRKTFRRFLAASLLRVVVSEREMGTLLRRRCRPD
ncbi:MAG: DNA topoisomerase I, partial [Olpidium bornovanus]